jgi:hypothetical protein
LIIAALPERGSRPVVKHPVIQRAIGKSWNPVLRPIARHY